MKKPNILYYQYKVLYITYFGKYKSTNISDKKTSGWNLLFFKVKKVLELYLLYLKYLLSNTKIDLDICKNEYIILDHPSGKIAANIIESKTTNVFFRISFIQLLMNTNWFFLYAIFSRSNADYVKKNIRLIRYLVVLSEAKYIISSSDIRKIVLVDDMSSKKRAYYAFGRIDTKCEVSIMRMSEETGRPIPENGCDVLYCWTTQQVEESFTKKIAQKNVQLPMKNHSLKFVGKKYKNDVITVGIATNSKINREQLENIVEYISTSDINAKIIYRAHPGLMESEHWIDKSIVEFNNPSTDVADFFDSIDVLFAGLSSMLVLSFQYGVPSVYFGGLDPYLKNLRKKGGYYNRWITTNYVFQHTGSLEKDIKNVDAFYASEIWQQNRNEITAFNPKALNLKKI